MGEGSCRAPLEVQAQQLPGTVGLGKTDVIMNLTFKVRDWGNPKANDLTHLKLAHLPFLEEGPKCKSEEGDFRIIPC